MFKSATSMLIAAFLTLVIGALTILTPVLAQSEVKSAVIDSDADGVLRGMATYLKGLPSYTVSFDSDLEVLTHDSEKLQFSSSGAVALERPRKFHATRRGGVIDAEFTYDGKSLTLHDRGQKIYAQYDVLGSIDDALDAARDVTGFHFAGADLLYGDVYPGLNLEVRSATYIGVVMVNGIEAHHLAYRAKDIDWQIWVQTGEKPLPLKYVITSKWMAAAPQFSVRLRDWDTSPKLDAKNFMFTPPDGTRKVEEITVNQSGEIEVME
jgi:hypothetical protein